LAEVSSAFRVASSLAVLSRTSTTPAATGWPASNWMLRTTPPASVVTSVPLTAINVPTASPPSLQRCGLAVVAETAAAGCGMLSKKLLVCLAKNALSRNTPPNTTATPTSIRAQRKTGRDGRREDWAVMGKFLGRSATRLRQQRQSRAARERAKRVGDHIPGGIVNASANATHVPAVMMAAAR